MQCAAGFTRQFQCAIEASGCLSCCHLIGLPGIEPSSFAHRGSPGFAFWTNVVHIWLCNGLNRVVSCRGVEEWVLGVYKCADGRCAQCATRAAVVTPRQRALAPELAAPLMSPSLSSPSLTSSPPAAVTALQSLSGPLPGISCREAKRRGWCKVTTFGHVYSKEMWARAGICAEKAATGICVVAADKIFNFKRCSACKQNIYVVC